MTSAFNERRNIALLTVTGRVASEDDGLPSLLYTNVDSSMTDEEERAIRRLVESWMDRLQLISVLAIFFASTEATLLSITMPEPGADDPYLSLTANAGLTSGLVLHILAAFISSLGGFFLIQYKIKWAKVERNTVMKKRQSNISSSGSIIQTSPVECDIERGGHPTTPPGHRAEKGCELLPPKPGLLISRWLRRLRWELTEYSAAFCSLLHLRSTHICPAPGSPPLPTKLLGRFHCLCVVLTLLGFMFTLVGIVCNAWERLPHVVGIVCTITISITLITVLAILIFPDDT